MRSRGNFAGWQPDRGKTSCGTDRCRDRAADGWTGDFRMYSTQAGWSPSAKFYESKICTATGMTDVSFHINAGEVVGFAGLVGAGRTELAKVIFGEMPKNSGSILLDWSGSNNIRRPDQAISKGIGFAPEDRKREGLVLIRSVMENASMAILQPVSRFHFVRQPTGASYCVGLCRKA